MNNKIQSFIYGIYLSITIGICGYLYLNPEIIKTNRKLFDGSVIVHISYENFKYSVLTSIVLGILLFTFINFFNNKK